MTIPSSKHSTDIGRLLDEGPWTPMQKLVVVLVAVAIILDGFDGQLIGFAIPVMIKEWGVTRSDFGPVIAAGLVGMAIGSASAGLIADRFGRRYVLIASVVLFGIATSLIGLSQNVIDLGIFRLIAGIGIGGALPTSTTMTAEYTPASHRTMAITATIVCVPLGGALAGVFSSFAIPLLGWRGMFFIGGLLPLALSVVLLVMLPESPRFLSRIPSRWTDLRHLLVRMSRPVNKDASFTDVSELDAGQREGFSSLFKRGRLRDTILIWTAFFLNLLAVYTAFSWLPAMLVSEGLDLSVAGHGLTYYNFGGILGALLCAWAITRFGSRWPLVLCCAGGALSAFALLFLDIAQNTTLLFLGFGIHGLFVNAVQSTMFALCAYVYPTSIRATGTAAALFVGRFGSIFSAFAGAGVISFGGASAYLTMLGIALLGVLISLMMVSRHIPAMTRS